MELYIYESHLGELYTSTSELNDDTLYCECCGDYDWYIGCASTRAEAMALLEDLCYTIEYITGFVEERWEE